VPQSVMRNAKTCVKPCVRPRVFFTAHTTRQRTGVNVPPQGLRDKVCPTNLKNPRVACLQAYAVMW